MENKVGATSAADTCEISETGKDAPRRGAGFCNLGLLSFLCDISDLPRPDCKVSENSYSRNLEPHYDVFNA